MPVTLCFPLPTYEENEGHSRVGLSIFQYHLWLKKKQKYRNLNLSISNHVFAFKLCFISSTLLINYNLVEWQHWVFSVGFCNCQGNILSHVKEKTVKLNWLKLKHYLSRRKYLRETPRLNPKLTISLVLDLITMLLKYTMVPHAAFQRVCFTKSKLGLVTRN